MATNNRKAAAKKKNERKNRERAAQAAKEAMQNKKLSQTEGEKIDGSRPETNRHTPTAENKPADKEKRLSKKEKRLEKIKANKEKRKREKQLSETQAQEPENETIITEDISGEAKDSVPAMQGKDLPVLEDENNAGIAEGAVPANVLPEEPDDEYIAESTVHFKDPVDEILEELRGKSLIPPRREFGAATSFENYTSPETKEEHTPYSENDYFESESEAAAEVESEQEDVLKAEPEFLPESSAILIEEAVEVEEESADEPVVEEYTQLEAEFFPDGSDALIEETAAAEEEPAEEPAVEEYTQFAGFFKKGEDEDEKTERESFRSETQPEEERLAGASFTFAPWGGFQRVYGASEPGKTEVPPPENVSDKTSSHAGEYSDFSESGSESTDFYDLPAEADGDSGSDFDPYQGEGEEAPSAESLIDEEPISEFVPESEGIITEDDEQPRLQEDFSYTVKEPETEELTAEELEQNQLSEEYIEPENESETEEIVTEEIDEESAQETEELLARGAEAAAFMSSLVSQAVLKTQEPEEEEQTGESEDDLTGAEVETPSDEPGEPLTREPENPPVLENYLAKLISDSLSAPAEDKKTADDSQNPSYETVEATQALAENKVEPNRKRADKTKKEKVPKKPKSKKVKEPKPEKIIKSKAAKLEKTKEPKPPKRRKPAEAKEPKVRREKAPKQKRQKKGYSLSSAANSIKRSFVKINSFWHKLPSVIRIVTALLLMFATLAGVMVFCISHFSYRVPQKAVPVYKGIMEPVRNVREIEFDLPRQLAEAEDMDIKGDRKAFKFYANTELMIDEWYERIPIMLGNVETNKCDFIVTLLDKDDNMLYRSLGIKPGNYLPAIALFKEEAEKLGYGTHDLYLVVSGYNSSTFEHVGTVYTKFKLVIGFEQGREEQGEQPTEQIE